MDLRLVRSIEIGGRSEVKLAVEDTTSSAKLFFKRFKVDEDYQSVDFVYKSYPIDSYIMNKIFKMTEETGFFAEVPEQPCSRKASILL